MPKKQNRRRCSSLISCGILRGTEVAEVWFLKLLAELNHRRWFSATDINTDQGGAGACQLAARIAPRSGYSSVVRRENGYYIETVWHGIGLVYRRWSMSSIKRDVKKKAPPRPEEIRSRDPAHCVGLPLKMFGLWSILVSFLCCWWQRSSMQDAASRTMLTMVLSEARGLSLFLVIRGGIACNG